ncbi:Peptidase C12 ubiquitin carboxyl-terminal hydrolase [Trinorchestia longiramus]|nr:Peptidase C12 ubiquitin carboxyl-terminal hydrolase [Trinorchestia longiramus]
MLDPGPENKAPNAVVNGQREVVLEKVLKSRTHTFNYYKIHKTVRLEVEEIWSLDDDAFVNLKPVHGLIFLFKWQKLETQPETTSSVLKNPPPSLFFAKQVINNACATQAVLSVLLNTSSEDLKLGSTLSEFKEFTAAFDPNLKGLALSNCDTIRNVHNSFARQTLFEFDQSAATKDDDVFHFISYVPHEGRLYELDGLQEGPIDLGEIAEGQDWLGKVQPIIQQRMLKYSSGEIHFNLMALVSDKKMMLEKEMKVLESVAGTESRMAELRQLMIEEESKRARWRQENIRRKHNYLPLIVNMLQMLAKEDKLLPIYNAAKKKAIDAQKFKQSKGKAA